MQCQTNRQRRRTKDRDKAGGLNADNVASAIKQLRPAGVDVSGGVETSPGIKCPERITDFVRAVRAADLTKSEDET